MSLPYSPEKMSSWPNVAMLYDFFEQRGCEDSLVNEIDRMIEEIKSSSTFDFSIFSQEETTDHSKLSILIRLLRLSKRLIW